MAVKGIILAGGAGSRLHPLTGVVTKQLQAVYDKPMVYYPLSTLMLADIRDVLLISTPQDLPRFEAILGDGEKLGMRITYEPQEKPRGIAEAFLIGAEFIGDDRVCLILGDNIFYGYLNFLRNAIESPAPATVFGYWVRDPERYGVVEFDEDGQALSIEEKPKAPRSSYAVPGCYVYGPDVVDIARNLSPSGRGELEITDVNLEYLRRGDLKVVRLGRGMAWLDTGTHESLLEAANFIATIEARQGLKIGCIEEIAFRQGFIDRDGMQALIDDCPNCGYRDYLVQILEEGRS
jgi:glucose-1-phosphate thymidylyltransferase